MQRGYKKLRTLITYFILPLIQFMYPKYVPLSSPTPNIKIYPDCSRKKINKFLTHLTLKYTSDRAQVPFKDGRHRPSLSIFKIDCFKISLRSREMQVLVL
jgi:hypothetical protein